jgi:glycopeptide antibiotics resistance protein
VLDHSGGGHDLKIPPKIPILDKKILSSNWNQLEFDLKSFQDIFINLVGFIPLGFMLAITFSKAGAISERQSILISVILCFAVSLMVEVMQAWIPSRNSDSLDLMLNTIGGFAGAIICYKVTVHGSRRTAQG